MNTPQKKLLERRQREKKETQEANEAEAKLANLSFPPTDAELQSYEAVDEEALPRAFKRDPSSRVFVNRSMRLDKIEWYGFDMDYTLAEYIHPQYDEMIYELIKSRLVELGYPSSILELVYEPEFPIRSLFVDRKLGNLLKIGKFGEILQAMHGRTPLSKEETLQFYPAMQIRHTDIGVRFLVQHTLFSMPEMCLFADLINHLEQVNKDCSDGHPEDKIMLKCDLEMSYTHLHNDVRTATDEIHASGVLKKKTMADLPRYVHRNPQKLATLLRRMKQSGAKTFLLTNSEYYYTDAIMSYLLEGAVPKAESWRDYFDIAITSACKPSFFSEGSTFREIDIATGKLKLGRVLSEFQPASKAVYAGGSLALFSQLTGAKSTSVLYVGDHIFADIIKSKREVFWRTLLIVPEIGKEVTLTSQARPLLNRLRNLHFMKAEIFRGLDVESQESPDISALHADIKHTSEALDKLYSPHWGSPFRSGAKQTYFALQTERFADLYSASALNLFNYPTNYSYTAEIAEMPHEFN